MQVIRTIPVFYPTVTGPANQAFHVSKGLRELGVHSTVVAAHRADSQLAATESIDGIPTIRLRESVGLMAYRRTLGLNVVCDAQADLIHAHCYRNRLTSYAFKVSRQKNKPFVFQPHGNLLMYRFLFSSLRQIPYRVYDLWTGKKEARQADAVVVATDQERDEAIQFGVPEDRLHVIPVGANCIASRTWAGQEREHIKILFVGRICKDRNLEQILRAIAELKDLPLQLRIVGPAATRSALSDSDKYLVGLTNLVQQLDITDRIDFVGPKFGDELAAEYSEADLFVYTSVYENFGQAMLEAAANGCPVIATQTGVARSIVLENQTGHFVDYDDHLELARKIRLLESDREKLAAMGRNILELARRQFDWKTVVKMYHDLYRSLN